MTDKVALQKEELDRLYLVAPELQKVGMHVGRNITAVIDAMCQRGAIKGEEMASVGQLRDQAIQLVTLCEELHSVLGDPE